MFVRASSGSGGGGATDHTEGLISAGGTRTITTPSPIKYVGMMDKGNNYTYYYVPDIMGTTSYYQNDPDGNISSANIGDNQYSRVQSVSADLKEIKLASYFTIAMTYIVFY